MNACKELGQDAGLLYSRRDNMPYATRVYFFETWKSNVEILDALTDYDETVRGMLLEEDMAFSVRNHLWNPSILWFVFS